jgi:multidrug efflux pump
MKEGVFARLLGHPVLAGLGAAALGIFGLAAMLTLPVRSGPFIPYRLIDINTNFPGADAQTMDRFVTLPLESALAALGGVNYVTGTTQTGNSDINAYLADGAVPDTVFGEALAAVNATRSNLPAGIQAPVLKLVGDADANQELGISVVFPPSLTMAAVTAYTTADIVPRLESIPGIGPVTLYSGTPSLRVNMDPLRLQALGLTPAQVAQTVTDDSAVDAAGVLRNNAIAMPVNARTQLASPADFDALPVTNRNGTPILLGSLASTGIGFDPGTDIGWYNRVPSIYIAAGIAPSGNIIAVARQVRQAVAAMQPLLPPGVKLVVSYDESRSVSESLRDLSYTLIVTILLVAFIVRLSLGAMRAAAAPFAAIMLSLLGAGVVMQLTGQTLNLFTIIALVLAVGLVVDDAIVVVEDVFRRVQEGQTPREAAAASVTRLAPVLAAISSTLVVAFLPLGFLSGLTAALFRPFALVLIAAFLLSLVIALTVVPVMAMWASRTYVHRETLSFIDRLCGAYQRALAPVLRVSPLVAVLVLVVMAGCAALLDIAPRNLVPAADGLNVDIFSAAPNGASIGYMLNQTAAMETVLHNALPGQPEWLDTSEQNHTIFGGYEFDTPALAHDAVLKLTAALNGMNGLSSYVSQENGMPGTEDLPVSVLLSGQTSAANLLDLATKIQTAAYATGDFNYLSISPDQPQYQYALHIDRARAARLGIGDAAIGDALGSALAGGNLGQVNINGMTMNVVTQMPTDQGTASITAIPVAAASGALVPLGTFATLEGNEQPNALGSWQGLPSINIQAQQAQGVSLSKALDDLHREFNQLHAGGVSFGYSGPSETFKDSDRQNARLFMLGLLGMFFLLAAQFRSVIDPFVVITTVPLASLGPLLLFVAGGATLNIVTEIALLTVWGLIARQGILFVQVAEEGQAQHLPVREAALRAARLRFRPILMITLALIGGAVPLMLASGPQAVIRYDLGVVLATGMGSGFLLSLFAVPAMYCLLRRRRDA